VQGGRVGRVMAVFCQGKNLEHKILQLRDLWGEEHTEEPDPTATVSLTILKSGERETGTPSQKCNDQTTRFGIDE